MASDLNTLLVIKRLRAGLNEYGTDPRSETEEAACDVLNGPWRFMSDEDVERILYDHELKHLETSRVAWGITSVSARFKPPKGATYQQILDAEEAYRGADAADCAPEAADHIVFIKTVLERLRCGLNVFGTKLLSNEEKRATKLLALTLRMYSSDSIARMLAGQIAKGETEPAVVMELLRLCDDGLLDRSGNEYQHSSQSDDSGGVATGDDSDLSANDRQVGGDHYRTGVVQHWDFVHMHDIKYHEAQVIRYIMRHHRKNGAEDVKKAIHFCHKILELYYDA